MRYMGRVQEKPNKCDDGLVKQLFCLHLIKIRDYVKTFWDEVQNRKSRKIFANCVRSN